jgi:hypothetical protein
LVKAGRLDLGAITSTVYPLAELVPAMEAAGEAGNLEQIVVRP